MLAGEKHLVASELPVIFWQKLPEKLVNFPLKTDKLNNGLFKKSKGSF